MARQKKKPRKKKGYKSKKKISRGKRKSEPRLLTEEDFEVKDSSIPGIGLGLFARVKVRKNDTIGYYTGKILTDRQANSNRYNTSRYLLWICTDHWIDGQGKGSNYTRYINHSEKPNAELVTSVRWKTARFRALKNIKPGQEIFFDYGEDYWSEDDIVK